VKKITVKIKIVNAWIDTHEGTASFAGLALAAVLVYYFRVWPQVNAWIDWVWLEHRGFIFWPVLIVASLALPIVLGAYDTRRWRKSPAGQAQEKAMAAWDKEIAAGKQLFELQTKAGIEFGRDPSRNTIREQYFAVRDIDTRKTLIRASRDYEAARRAWQEAEVPLTDEPSLPALLYSIKEPNTFTWVEAINGKPSSARRRIRQWKTGRPPC
jgi:hypothetical protein